MIRVLTFAAALFAAPVAADPDRLSILLGSAHPGGPGYDGRNPGLFVTWEDRGGLDLSLGVFRNSHGRGAIATTAALPVLDWQDGGAALFLGVALYPGDGRHYRVSAGDLIPLGGVQIRQGNLFVQIMPSDGRHADAVISAGLTFDLGGAQ
ncbi:hypothetical protein [Pseudogemmobacter humi]|uniref:Uncharacterized protein n=1 Tax=Pseudogemmobacter humi TaxID=2483812 RepID=A0A3P5XQG7_9RHOB|nr:hypothetical protein [Pseudogemmobacter humi]VDC33121.1 hypothetical protein XINFAN_03647 [Pseudogemmobacter humi]